MNDNQKVRIINLADHEVGFNCVNFPAIYSLKVGQALPVKWEHLLDASYNKGLNYMFRHGILKVDPANENYQDIMDDLQLSDMIEEVETFLSYTEAKKLLSTKPIQIVYSRINAELEKDNPTSKENILTAAMELGIKDYTINEAIKKATGTDVIKALGLKEKSSESVTKKVKE